MTQQLRRRTAALVVRSGITTPRVIAKLPTSYTLYVATLGASYGVMDNTITKPGFSLAYVFDHNWKYVGNQAL